MQTSPDNSMLLGEIKEAIRGVSDVVNKIDMKIDRLEARVSELEIWRAGQEAAMRTAESAKKWAWAALTFAVATALGLAGVVLRSGEIAAPHTQMQSTVSTQTQSR